ncbi:FAD-binding protein [Desulfitobacterium sp. THU1]|uniref:FAD-binding protein n=1 Tax=Desulfitobacterium sp. THU1 TaxID=3138072 RepID=UPI00311DBFC7
MAWVLVFSIAGCSNTAPQSSSVTYVGTAQGFGGEVEAKVTVDQDGKITQVALSGENETPNRGGTAMKTLEQAIVAANGTNVDGVSGATFTSKAVIDAVNKALADKVIASEEPAAAIAYTAGTYTGKAFGFTSYITVETEFSADKILSVKVKDNSGETPYLRDLCAEKIPNEIVARQSLDVDAVSGATWGSKAIIDAVADCVQQAGSADVVSALKKVSIPRQAGEDKVYDGYDLCVVGGGGSGLISAAVAASDGLKVIVIEAADRWGGVSEIAGGGTLAIGTDLQQNAVQPDGSVKDLYKEKGTTVAGELEKFIQQYQDSTHYQADYLMIKNFLLASGDAADFLSEEYGMKFTAVSPNKINYPAKGTRWNAVAKQLEDQGATMLMATRGEHLIMGSDGKITGVTAVNQDTGAKITINSKAVVLATGGSANNTELMKQYLADYNDEYMNWGSPTANGDGVQMAWEAGAEQAAFGSQSHNEGLPIELHDLFDLDITNGNCLYANLVYEPMLRINRDTGRRISDETIMYTPHYQGNTSMISKGALVIVDQAAIDSLMENGSKTKPWRSKLYQKPMNQPDYTGLNLQQQIDEVVSYSMQHDSGYAYKAGTIEELAGMLGLDPDVVKKEVSKYNTAVGTGADPEFDRDPSTLVYPVANGPFYAFETKIRNLGTWGGIKTDETLGVYNTKGGLIPGLYSTGFDALGWVGTSYFVDTTTLGWMTASGYMAGNSVVDYVNNKK